MAASRIDARDRPIGTVRDPDATRPARDSGGCRAHFDARHHPSGLGVEGAGTVRGDRSGPHVVVARQGNGAHDRDRDHRGTGESDRAPSTPARRDRRDGCRTLRSRQVEGGVLGEHRGLEPAQLWAGLEPQLVDQRSPRRAVRGERVRLSPRSVEREHVLTHEPLAVGMLAGEQLELRHERGVAAERQLGVDAVLGRP
jgi:hypothetical protein